MASKQPNGAKKAPISSHKAFPAIVALWFAALFGIGSFVLPAQLFGAVTGQEALGVTLKIVIALVAAIIGAALGLWIASKIKASQMEAPVRKCAPTLRASDTHPDAPARRPISAMEELGEEKLAESVPEDDSEEAIPHRRRRPLSVTGESGRSEYLDFVPPPGLEHDKARAAFPAEDSADVVDFSDHPDMLPAEKPLSEVAKEEVPAPVEAEQAAEFVEALPFAAPVEDDEPLELVTEEYQEPEMSEVLDLVEPTFVEAKTAEEPEDVTEAQNAEASSIPLANRPVEELGIVELVERLAITIKQRKESPISAHAAFSESFFTNPAAQPQTFEAAKFNEGQPDEPQELRPMPSALQSLMLDEHDDDEDDDDDMLPALDLKTALRRFGAPSQDQESAKEKPPVEATEDAEGGHAADLAEPTQFVAEAPEEVAKFDKPVAAQLDDAEEFAAEDEDQDQEGSEDGGYTSLLAMKSPFLPGQEPVRIEEDNEIGDEIQPMVVFPNADIVLGQPSAFGSDESEEEAAPEPANFGAPSAARPFDAPFSNAPAAAPAPHKADPAETEKALRDALSTLRRMSGAA